MSKLMITLELEALQKLLEEAAENGSSAADTWTDYSAPGIAYTLVSENKLLSQTFMKEEEPARYREHPG